MNTRIVPAAAALLSLSAVLLTGCTGDDDPEPQESSTHTTTDADGTTGGAGQAPYNTPKKPDHEPVRGADAAAIEETIRAFIPYWAAYSPWDFGNTKQDYFERWEGMATDSYGMEQYRNFDANWSWTWTDETKAYNAKVESIGEITITGDTAVANRVVVTRHLLPVLGRQADDKVETKVYTIRLAVSDGGFPKVSGVTSLGDTNKEDSSDTSAEDQ